MNDEKITSAGGVGFVGLLQVALIVLKLCGIINWSWWWILAPAWITAATGVLLLIIAFILYILSE